MKVSTDNRDRLAAIAAPGETMDIALGRVLVEFERARTREKLSGEARLAAARNDAEAIAWVNRNVSMLAEMSAARRAARQ
jgi:hypothetical protein